MQRTVFAKSSFEFKIHARDTKIITERIQRSNLVLEKLIKATTQVL